MDDNKKLEYRTIIMDHFTNPENLGEFENKVNVFGARQKSAVCADDIYVELKIENNIIVDGKYSGSGCAFSTSAADILLSNIKNMNLQDAFKYLENYNNMCTGKDYEISEEDEARIFQTVRKEINRVNCVLLPAEAIRHIISKEGD